MSNVGMVLFLIGFPLIFMVFFVFLTLKFTNTDDDDTFKKLRKMTGIKIA
jgi:hypothetical protein